jgi:FkbM family methyltransferase
MNKLKQRACSFVTRVSWLKEFMPSTLATVYHLIKIKINANTPMTGTYKGLTFTAYPQDLSAVKEVLVDTEYDFLKDIIHSIEAPSILDVGGNIGTFSLWILGENKNANILSIEASPKTFETINKTVKAAQEKGFNWACKNKAAWKDNSDVFIKTDGDSMGHKVSDDGGSKIKGITLQELISTQQERSKTTQIDILKVDIEGAEEAFLADTEDNKASLENVKNLVIELHPNYCDVTGVETLIKACYKHIIPQMDRLSDKPLLHCYN